MSSAAIDSLTPREREILVLIAEGHSLAGIAQKFSRSLKTIESHRLSIGRKLKASNRVELTKIAITHGLISLTENNPSAIQGGSTPAGLNDDLAVFEAINKALENRSGQAYIAALFKAICKELDVHLCGICLSAPEISQDERFVVAMCQDHKMQPTFYYSLLGSPVAQAYKNGSILVEDGLAKSYPDIPFYAAHGLRSYYGLRLDGDYGAEPGVLAIVDNQPLDSPATVQRILGFLVDRTSAELTLLHKTQEIEMLKQQLRQSDSDANTDAQRKAI